MPRPRRTTPPPPRPGSRHALLTGEALDARRAELDDLRLRVEVAWGDSLRWGDLERLAGLPASRLRVARLGRSMPEGTIAALLRTARELSELGAALPEDVAPCEAAAWLTGPRRVRLADHEVEPLEAAADYGARLLGDWREAGLLGVFEGRENS